VLVDIKVQVVIQASMELPGQLEGHEMMQLDDCHGELVPVPHRKPAIRDKKTKSHELN
jgi:hypothetical protein